MVRTLLTMAFALPLALAHGVITKAVSGTQKACAVNTAFACGSGDKLRLREVIPRSGNTGSCASPPGCEADFKCDWCGLEKARPQSATIGSKWWTSNPATHWDNPAVWPQNVCMSKDAFGARGQMNVAKGASISTTMYVNADHSGLYQWQLSCGTAHTNQKFMDGPITAWKMLHKNKEYNGAKTINSREVGRTRKETDAHFQSTVCTGAACNYRMNRNIQGADSAHCRSNPGDCFVDDVVTIPANFACSGKATLRWFWLSSEGPEIYANCLDLNIGAGTGTAPTAAPAPTPAPVTGGGTCPASGDCRMNPTCCASPTKCYEKDQYWASCMAVGTCVPGIHTSDELQYRTPWSCKLLGATTTPAPATCANQRWGQCGGKDWKGAKCCSTRDACKVQNQWYSQCVPAGSGYELEASELLVQEKVQNCTNDEYFPLMMGLEVACDCEFGLPTGGCKDKVCANSQTMEGCLLAAGNAAMCTLGSEMKAILDGCNANTATIMSAPMVLLVALVASLV